MNRTYNGAKLRRSAMRLIAVALLTAFGTAPSGRAQEPTTTERGVVLTGEQAAMVFNQCSRVTPENPVLGWSPKLHDIEEVEAGLTAFLEGKSLPLSPQRYCFQYVGYSVDGGRYIYINIFPANREEDDWKQSAVIVCDGGKAYCGVVYNVEQNRFEQFDCNGEA